MSDKEKITFILTTAQLRNLKRKTGFQISHKQLKSEDPRQKHMVDIEISPAKMKKIVSAMKSGKGVRMNPDDCCCIDGGSLKSDMKKLKKVGKTITKGVQKGVKEVSKVANIVHDQVYEHAGDVAENVKKVIPQNLAKTALNTAITTAIIAGTTAVGNPKLAPLLIPMATSASNTGVNMLYKTDFSKKQSKANILKNIQSSVIDEAKTQAIGQLSNSLKPSKSPAPATTGSGLKEKKKVVRHQDGRVSSVNVDVPYQTIRMPDGSIQNVPVAISGSGLIRLQDGSIQEIHKLIDPRHNNPKHLPPPRQKTMMPKPIITRDETISGGSFLPLGKGLKAKKGGSFAPL